MIGDNVGPGHDFGDGTKRVGRDLSFEPVDI
ncbi:MAG: hypothetical protein UW41_C0037G0001, partial [Candidatus Collierbacteria bacterium GW2011_GWC2_44_18]